MVQKRVKLTDDTEEVLVYQSAPTHPDGVALLNLWKDRMADDGFVMGRDIPSRDTAHFLPGIMIMEPLPDFRDFYIRLAGTRQRKNWSKEATGLKLSEISNEDLFESRLEFTARVLQSGTPITLDVVRLRRAIPIEHRETSLLPILAADRLKPLIMVFTAYFSVSSEGA